MTPPTRYRLPCAETNNTVSSYLTGNLRSRYNEYVQTHYHPEQIDTPDSEWYDETNQFNKPRWEDENFHRNEPEHLPFKQISDKRFEQLTIGARKKGAVIIRGTPEAEAHLRKQNATASHTGGCLIFMQNVSISEVLEELRHFEQGLMGLNDEVDNTALRIVLNEIEAREYILQNAFMYGVPRIEQEYLREQLSGLRQLLQTIKEE